MADLSQNVNRLRFMTKARETAAQDGSAHPQSDSGDRWTLTASDSSMTEKMIPDGPKLTSLNVTARRSYGGINPYIESRMESEGRKR